MTPRSAATVRAAIATFDGFGAPVVMMKKALLKHSSVFGSFALFIGRYRHSQSSRSSSDGDGGLLESSPGLESSPDLSE